MKRRKPKYKVFRLEPAMDLAESSLRHAAALLKARPSSLTIVCAAENGAVATALKRARLAAAVDIVPSEIFTGTLAWVAMHPTRGCAYCVPSA